jgi:WD40 repeat protein/mono/diheme cytochrome c family protein
MSLLVCSTNKPLLRDFDVKEYAASMILRRCLFLELLALFAWHGPRALAGVPEEEAAKPVSYYKQIRPIFQAQCHGCHQPAKPKGGYVMTDFEKLLAGGDSAAKGETAIVPKDPEKSLLLQQITPVQGEAEMPEKKPPLPDTDIALVKRWIAEGAVDDTPANARQRYDLSRPPIYARPPVVSSLDFSPDGTELAVGGFHEVLIHKADGSELLGRLIGLAERIQSVRYSPDGKWLAVAGGQPARMGEVQIWDVAKRKLHISVPVTFDTVYGVSWSPDSKTVAFGCSDRTVRAISAETGQQVLQQGSHSDWVLDTVFSTKGDHVVSVSRDMSVKLTEFATQRFVDNITSITPGALRGGIHAVARHPQRDEVLIGGADGKPEIFRIFRQTARKIGDNAGLVRKLPPMEGRIYAVDYASDGKQAACGSSLDGKGQVEICELDFDPALPPELAKLMEREGSKFSAEEKAKLDAYWSNGVKLKQTVGINAGVYALAFRPDNQAIAAAGEDGVVRLIDVNNGAVTKEFVPVPLAAAATAGK